MQADGIECPPTRRKELAPRLRAVGDEAGVALGQIGLFLACERVRSRALALRRHIHAINLFALRREQGGWL